MISYSVKLKGNMQRISKIDGTAPLYLIVIINSEDKLIPLNLRWPAELIDNKIGLIKARNNRDKEFKDNQLIIQTELNKVNEIFKIYRISDKVLTLDGFLKEYKTFDRRKDFITFLELEIEERYKSDEISNNTRKNQRSTVKMLRQFKKSINFYEINSKFLKQFVKYLKADKDGKKGNEDATIWGRINHITTYLGIAKGNGIAINEDYENYINKAPSGRIIYLEESELYRLIALYNGNSLSSTHYITLKAFLFSCFSSLRISDVRRAEWGWVNLKNEMQFIPAKNLRRSKKEVTVPLSNIAKAFIDKRTGYFFGLPSDQEMNRSLKDIAQMVDIKKKLTFHVARHTFGTQYYRHTKDVVSLQKIMGHYKLDTTMVYVHINEQDKRNGIEKMEDAFKSNLAVMRLVG